MRRVLKIGGSLLLQESLIETLQSWLQSQPPAQTIAIVGGGELIDAIRRLDARHPADPSWVHWQCVGLLRTTFEWTSAQLSQWSTCSTRQQFQRLKSQASNSAVVGSQSQSSVTLVAVDSFYQSGDDPPLPEDWTTTTDAIAGWLAIMLAADELVLLKSCAIEDGLSITELAERGVVDAALPGLADQLPPLRLIDFATEMNR
ncbi:protein kinase [Stieleria sp. TO1_6]|uniref:protein kinase n=1 Tax=Stieleria tagensis TaxID=2956795 RepID=UPI00209B9EBE|nr:protein kinase [Stieleria tagensis]MCO8125213.1 protein kinase [Stieleria tagensis]